jgi:N-acetylglucosaminyldiphosphoundecaprenol N-acetyl-beta-D-mannosaminyltransferase
MYPNKTQLLNIEVDNWKFHDFVDQLDSGVVVTPNVDHLIKLQKDQAFYQFYRGADHIVCDSKILLLLSRLLRFKSPIREQIAGSDLFPAFCKSHAKDGKFRVFLLGGQDGSEQIARRKINQACDSNIVVDAYSPPFGFERDEVHLDYIRSRILNSGANVVAVGLGAPKQEMWIANNKEALPSVKLFFAIGATIDFQAGSIQRAPRWMQASGLEWLYRFTREPKRLFRRYFIEDMPILYLMMKQRLGAYRNPWQ